MRNTMKMMKTVLTAAAIVVATGLGGTAMAQPGGGRGMGGGMGMFGGGMFGGGGTDAPVTKAEVDRYGKILKFTSDQSEAAKALFEGFEAAYKPKQDAARKAMEDAREEFRETRDPGVWTTVGEKMTKLRDERAAAEKQFLDDVKSLLTPEQAAVWPKVERERRREKVMRQGLMSGERADLVKIVENLKLGEDASKAVAPVLDTYEVDIDAMLVKRNEVTEKAMSQGNKLREAFMGGDMTEVNKLFEDGREAAVRVRDTNRRYAKQIEGLLAGEEQAKFNAEFRKESYPQIYRTTRYGTRVIEAAAAMELDATSKQSLEAIKADFEQRNNALNDQAEKAQDAQEENFSIQNMMGGGNNEEMTKVRTARRELETKTIEQVKALLTPEQVAKLPERGNDGGGPGGGGGGDGARPARNNNAGGDNGGGNNGGGNRRQRQGGGGNAPAPSPSPAPANTPK